MRGTKWLTEDRCNGTLTRVKKGTVTVRDFKRKRNVIVRAGQRYLARARVSWVSVFASFLVAHMVGDYLFQTDWQARNKRGGLSGGVALRALATHVTTYTLAFLPALVWIGDVLDPGWGFSPPRSSSCPTSSSTTGASSAPTSRT